MDHRKHMYVMLGLVAVGAGLFFSGNLGGGALFLLWPLACMGMMFAMMWSMMRTRRDPDATPTPPHEKADLSKHSHL